MKGKQGGLRLLAAAALCTALWMPAWGAEPVSVQLNGELLSFTDASPEIVDGRTFLPYRAVFDALGAQVSYEADTHTAVAVREGVTVRVPIGETRVSVEQDGVARVLEMDVASYVKDGRTYVPVRFMAQALDCLVGWDHDDRTVIMVEKDEPVRQAMEGVNFSYIQAYNDFLQTYQTGNWWLYGDVTQQKVVRIDGRSTTLSSTGGQFKGIVSEVLFSLLNALALVVANVACDLDVTAKLLSNGCNVLRNGHGVVLNVSLLGKAVGLVELAESALNDVSKNVVGLVCHLGVLLHLLDEDSLLLSKNGCGNGLTVKVLNLHSGGLERNVPRTLREALLVSNVGIEAYDNAGRAKAVDIGGYNALNDSEAADGKLLADLVDSLCKRVSYGALTLGELRSEKRLNVSGLVCDYGLENVLNELLEGCVLSNEVGLGVNLNDSGGVADGHNVNETLSSDTVSLLCGSSHALLTKELNSSLEVAVGCGERVLAVHHTAAGLLSELGYVFSCECHIFVLLKFRFGENYSADSTAASSAASAAGSS